jgi:hypothetical protein
LLMHSGVQPGSRPQFPRVPAAMYYEIFADLDEPHASAERND